MRPVDPPPATYSFGYKNPPRSGNEINGLNESEVNSARPVFHQSGTEELDWKKLDDFFSVISPWKVVRYMLWNSWILRNENGRVAKIKKPIDSFDVKKWAGDLGADLVGITKIPKNSLYKGKIPNYSTAICVAMQMDREEMIHVPQTRSAVEVMRTYARLSQMVISLAKKIRKRGWPAKAYGNPNSTDILHIPLAISSGLGELGKHGSLISKSFGSNIRLAAVLTNLPLEEDQPKEIGVDQICKVCRRCVQDCPPKAINETKQMVRGKRKWYVDFDKCVPYFVKTGGCAICIEVCPWSEPGMGFNLVDQVSKINKRRPLTPTPPL